MSLRHQIGNSFGYSGYGIFFPVVPRIHCCLDNLKSILMPQPPVPVASAAVTAPLLTHRPALIKDINYLFKIKRYFLAHCPGVATHFKPSVSALAPPTSPATVGVPVNVNNPPA
jgi:hypothetical protein